MDKDAAAYAMHSATEKEEHHDSFWAVVSGVTLDKAGDAAVEGGEAGFSESMFASRLPAEY